MSISNKEYGELLSSCFINGNVLTFIGKQPQNIREFYNRLADDLFNMRIPHWRVIGFWYWNDPAKAWSMIMNNRIYGQSMIELSRRMKYYIPNAVGGNDPEHGCFYGVAEDMSAYVGGWEFDRFDENYGFDVIAHLEGKHARNGVRHTNLLMKDSYKDVGCTTIEKYMDGIDQSNPVWTTSDPYYNQFSYDNEIRRPKMLIPNKYIGTLQDKHKESDLWGGAEDRTIPTDTRTFILFKRGTGRMDYKEARSLFAPNCRYFMPCETRWDLAEFLVPRIPNEGDTFIEFTYLETINDEVLTQILNEYGKELVSNEC